jgi:molybdopterin-guanine dinucleotide biosynthesis protein A
MCGGLSLRMGTDKGLIPIGNICWSAFMVQKLLAVNLPFCISINASQVASYSPFFSEEQLVIDSMAIGGPLNGLLSVHHKYPDNNLLLLACDMINMQQETLSRLIKTFNDEPDHDFYVYQHGAFAEPFCGIYTSDGLKKVLQNNDITALSNMSLQKVFNHGITRRLAIVEPESFNNYNTLPR